MTTATPARRAYLRAYQNQWLQKRRRAWLAENGPCRSCGSWDDLEVDHVDPAQKVTHRVWSWSADRRLAELAKCQVLCHDCHETKTVFEVGGPCAHGTRNRYRRYGCRCDLCRTAHAIERRRERSRSPRETLPVAVLRAVEATGTRRRSESQDQLSFWEVAS